MYAANEAVKAKEAIELERTILLIGFNKHGDTKKGLVLLSRSSYNNFKWKLIALSIANK